MPCCGQKRAALKKQTDHFSSTLPDRHSINPSVVAETKERKFRYIGSASLVITGAISSTKYTFRFNGDVCLVDERDAPAMMAEPFLQYVRSTEK